MFVVHNRITAPSDQAPEFEKSFVASMRATLSGVPGLMRSTLMKPTADHLPYVSTMEFDSKESFMAWMQSAAFKDAHKNVDAPGMQAPSSIESYTVVEDVRP